MYFEKDDQLDRREQLLFMEVLMQFLLNVPFYTLIANSTKAEIDKLRHVVSSQSSDAITTVADLEVDCKQSLADE